MLVALTPRRSRIVPSNSMPMRRVTTSAPRKWIKYLDRYPLLDAEPATARLTTALAKAAVRVHKSINLKTFKQEQEENWDHTLPGDCENFALAKRKRLGEREWPLGSLRIQQCILTTGQGHAILVFVTDRGDYVSCNITPEILPWESYPVRRWLGRSWQGRLWQQVDRRWRAARLSV